MKRQLTLLAFSLGMTAAMATPLPPIGVAIDEVYRSLRKEPLEAIHMEGVRYELVNDRFEPCSTRKEAKAHGKYVRRIAPSDHGWSVQVTDREGTLLMEGNSLDMEGTALDGRAHYYDQTGRLRAEGDYDRGAKTGTWLRYSATGERLPEKEYYAEDWEGMQVRLGLASMSGSVADGSAER